jgi:hypothetical protein
MGHEKVGVFCDSMYDDIGKIVGVGVAVWRWLSLMVVL